MPPECAGMSLARLSLHMTPAAMDDALDSMGPPESKRRGVTDNAEQLPHDQAVSEHLTLSARLVRAVSDLATHILGRIYPVARARILDGDIAEIQGRRGRDSSGRRKDHHGDDDAT